MNGAYDPLRLAIIAEELPGALDPARNSAVADRPAFPDGGDQLVLADQPVSVLDKKEQQGKNLRLRGEEAVVLAHFELAQVQEMFAPPVLHDGR